MSLLHLPILADYLLPKGASNLAEDFDRTWLLVLTVTGIFFCIVVGAMTYFVIRYRRRGPNDVTSKVTHNTPLEIVWTGIPLALVLLFFYLGFRGFLNYDTPRSDCVVIDVTAQKWFFTFTYPNGAQDGNLYLLYGQPVRLNLHSLDVLHGIQIPNFRVQRNLVPGRQTYMWFIPTELTPKVIKTDLKTGESNLIASEGWPIRCTQYCGDGHSRMFAQAFVLDKADYEAKMRELANPFKKKEGDKNVFVPFETLGKSLVNQLGCGSCHSIDGTAAAGPTWKGLWKRDHEFSYVNEPGYTLKAGDSDEKWEAYLRESMVNPDAKLVRLNGVNYHGMTSYAAQLSGSVANDEKQRAIVAYIKSLGNTGWKPDVTPQRNPDLFDADHPKLLDAQGVGVHPESVAGVEARKKLGTMPGAAGTQSMPATGSRPGN
jgi:cytochrome c oxidase subunit II